MADVTESDCHKETVGHPMIAGNPKLTAAIGPKLEHSQVKEDINKYSSDPALQYLMISDVFLLPAE